MTQAPTTDASPPDGEAVSFGTRFRRGALMMLMAVVFYLLMTGPLLWSCSRIDSDAWHSFVSLAISPILRLEAYDKRDYVESLQAISKSSDQRSTVWIPPSPVDSWWLAGLRSYWKLYGADTSLTYDILSMLSFYGIQ